MEKKRVHSCILPGLAFWLFLVAAGCGGGGGNGGTPAPPPVSVTISAPSNTVQAAHTLPFTSAVTGTTNQSVTWAVNGISGGNSSVGTISASGVFNAPISVPNPNSVTITATSVADSTKSASAGVTIVPSTISVTISAPADTVQIGHTLQFTAVVTGTTNQSVTWAVNGISGGNPSVGTIGTTGQYLAPISVPNPSNVTVTATSVADSTQSAAVSISIVSPPSPPGSWSRTAPFGGIISNLTVDPRARNIVYLAAFNAGVFKSSDSGQTWTQVIAPAQSSFNTNQISSIAVGSVSSTLYFVNGLLPNPLILYTSVDGGTTTSKQDLPANIPGTNLAVDPQNDHVLYISGPAFPNQPTAEALGIIFQLPQPMST